MNSDKNNNVDKYPAFFHSPLFYSIITIFLLSLIGELAFSREGFGNPENLWFIANFIFAIIIMIGSLIIGIVCGNKKYVFWICIILLGNLILWGTLLIFIYLR